MSLRDFLKTSFSQLLSAPRPSIQSHEDLLKIDAADEREYLKQQVTDQLTFLRAFDAEMRQTIDRLHEPEEGKLIPSQVNQLIKVRGRMKTVLAMTSVQIFSQAKNQTPQPVVQAKLALELGAASGEMEQILKRIGDLHAVLADMPLDTVSRKIGNPNNGGSGVLWLGDHVNVQGHGKGQLYDQYREGLTKLVMLNAYGKAHLLDLYPEPRKTLDQIRHDFKHAPLDSDSW